MTKDDYMHAIYWAEKQMLIYPPTPGFDYHNTFVFGSDLTFKGTEKIIFSVQRQVYLFRGKEYKITDLRRKLQEVAGV